MKGKRMSIGRLAGKSRQIIWTGGLVLGLLGGLVLPVEGLAEDTYAWGIYKTGIELFEAEEYEKAATAFREAYAAKPTWKMFYNIGQCEAALARYGLALEAFERYMVGGGDAIPPDRRDGVLSELQRLRLLVGVVEVEAEDGIEVVVDGITRAATPLDGPVRIAVGRHNIQLRRGTEILLDRNLSVAGGMTSVIKADNYKAESFETADDSPAVGGDSVGGDSVGGDSVGGDGVGEKENIGEGSKSNKKSTGLLIGGIVTGALGLGGAALGAVFLSKYIKDQREYEDLYDDKSTLNQAEVDRYYELEEDKLPLNQNLMIIGFAAGGALIVASVVMIVVSQTVLKDSKSKRAANVYAVPGGMGVSF
jgi:hypothetical protein